MVIRVQLRVCVDPEPNIRYIGWLGDPLTGSGTDFEIFDFFGLSDSKTRFYQIVSHQKFHVFSNQGSGRGAKSKIRFLK